MKKRCAVLSVILLFVCIMPVFAKNNVSQINVDVKIEDNGSAYVTQTWTGTFEQGTENYIPIENLDGITISDFNVSDVANGQYEYKSNWSVDDSFEEKSGKCGIIATENGYELCFGISQYGQNKYIIQYRLNGLVCGYSDFDGFNFMFVNREMSTFPTNATIKIHMGNGDRLDETNSKIWAFGYTGQIIFDNGSIFAYTESELIGSNSMIILFQLDKGVVTPIRTSNQLFQNVKDTAINGSNYNDGKPAIIVILLIVAFIFVFLISRIVLFILRKININKIYKQAEYYRGVPNGGNIKLSYYLSQDFDMADNEGAIIGACLLKMIIKGNLQPITTEKVGFMGKVKQSIELRLVSQPSDATLLRLYEILEMASNDDGVLQENEIKKYSKKQPEPLRSFIDSSKKSGENRLKSLGGFLKNPSKNPNKLSEIGKKELLEVMGLRKYLLEFSLIAEREIAESSIWLDYLVYATLFGIADKVMEQFKKVYPQNVEEFNQYERNLYFAMCYNNFTYGAMLSAEQARSAGGGGGSSLGGGGGFSGGGSGGGSR